MSIFRAKTRDIFRVCFWPQELGSKWKARTLASSNVVAQQKTALYDFHVAHGGKMVPFAGWSMPVQYQDSLIQSHLHTRKHASIFDVSHMMQTHIYGKDRVAFMESITVADIEPLVEGQGTLTVFTNDKGGIMDDLIVSKTMDDFLFVVSNAGCADTDLIHMEAEAEQFRFKGNDVHVERMCNGLLAVQGPEMTAALQPGIDVDLKKLPFMRTTKADVFGVPDCRVSRCGYTGEDGVEISMPICDIQHITESLLRSPLASVKMAGLGARDSLRLEAGLCLYGNDIDENTTPVQASLSWTIGKTRRKRADFPGAKCILNELKNKPSKRRVGFKSEGPPARAGTRVFNEAGSHQIGVLTSGCPSPSLRTNISMGYVPLSHVKPGSKVKFEIRKKLIDAEVTKMPFLPCNYYFVK